MLEEKTEMNECLVTLGDYIGPKKSKNHRYGTNNRLRKN